MATAASSYNVLIRVQAAQARREVRAFSAELAAAKRAAQGMGLNQNAQSSRSLAASNASVTSSYRSVTKAAQSASAAINAQSAAAARATATNRNLAASSAMVATRTARQSRNVAGRNAASQAAAADPAAASIGRTGTAAVGASARVEGLTAAVRTYSASARVAARNSDLLASSLTRVNTAAAVAGPALGRAAAQANALSGTTATAAAGAAAAAASAGKAAKGVEEGGDAAASALSDRMNRMRSLGASMTWAGRQVSMAFTLPFVLGAGAAVAWQMDVEKAATRMMKVYDDLGDGMLQVTGADGKLTFNGSPMDRFLTALSNKMGQTKAELTEIAADWAAVGLTGGNVAAATKLTSEAMILGDMESVEAAEALVSIQAQYNLAFGDFNSERERAQRAASGDVAAAKEQAEAQITLTGVLAQLNMIENQTATSMNDLIIGFSRSAVFAKEAGVGAEYLGAHLAALIPATGTAERAGNALKTIYASLSTDKSKPQIAALEGLAQTAGLASDAFTSAEFRSRGMEEGVERIAVAYAKLDGASKLQWGKDVFGIYQMVRGMHLLDDVARGLGETFTDDGKSISVLAAQFATLKDEGARSAFILREFGLDGSEVETITDAATGTQRLVNAKQELVAQLEAEAKATSDVSYYRQALSGQDSSKIYEQYSRELTQVLSSNPQMLKQSMVVIQNAMMKAIVPMIPLIVGFAQTIAKVAIAFSNLDPRWQKLIVYALAFLAIVGPLSILLGSTILMFALMGKSLIFLGGAFGLVGGKAAAMGGAFRGLMRFLSGGRLFKPVAEGAKAAGKALDDDVVKGATKIGPKLFGLLKGVGARIGPMLMGGLKGGLAVLAKIGPMIFRVLTGPIGLAIAAVTGILAYGGVTISDMFNSLFSGVGENVKELLYDEDIPIFARPFVAGVEIITKTLSNIPKFVATVFNGVYQAISRAAKGIYEMFSYINPFARHSPSLVENVTNGMAVVTDEFTRASGRISATMKSAYSDISSFGTKTAGLRIRAEQIETDKQRSTIATAAPDALPEFDRLTNTRGVLQRELDGINTRVKDQERVVDAAQRALDAYDAQLEQMNRTMEMSQRRLDAVQKSLDAAQKQYDYFAGANIAGLSEMEDKLFDNEMAQKRLQLAMSEAGGDELEKTSDTLAKIAGQLDDLSGARDDLRLAGAGSDILGTYDSQIASLRGQQRDLMSPAADSVATLQTQLETLEKQAERMELEKSLQFDPMTRQIERFKDTAATLPFEQIMAGMATSGAQVDLYQGQVDQLNASMESQRAAITAVEDTRYVAQQAQQREQDVLTALTETQSELSTAISDIDSALQLAVDSVEKYTAAMEEAKRAADDLAGAGGAGGAEDIGSGYGLGEGDLGGAALNPPGMPDIEKMIGEMETDLANAFNGIDLFPSFDGLKTKISTWWDQTVMQWFRDLPGNLASGLGDLVSGTAYFIGFLFGSIEKMRATFAEESQKYLGIAWEEISSWPGRIGAWFSEIDWSAIDWGQTLRNVLKIFTPGFWTGLAGELWTKLKQVATDALLGFVIGLIEWGQGIGEWINTHIVQPFLEGWRKAFDMHSPSRVMMGLGGDVIQGFFDGIVGLFWIVTNWVAGVGRRVLDAMGNAATWLLEAGKDVVRGLINGIASMAGELKDKVGGFFQRNVVDKVKGIFDSHSPSRVFMGIGNDVVRGLAIGIEDMVPLAQRASAELTDAVIPSEVTIPMVTAAPAVQDPTQNADPFAGLAAAAETNLPAITQLVTTEGNAMAAQYTATVAAMENQVLTGQQAYAATYAANTAALSLHTVTSAQATSLATVTAAQGMAAATVATAQNMALGTTTATNSMALGVTNSATLMANGVVGAMSMMAGQVSGIVTGQIAPVIGSFDPMLAAATGWFGAATNNIGTIWAGVGPKTADPARFVINDVYNGGLRTAWNSFNEFLGLPALPEHIARFATGGPVFGAGTATSDSIPALLSNGEHVIPAREVRAAGGHSAIEQQRRAWRKQRTQPDPFVEAKYAFAHGGPVLRLAGGGPVEMPPMRGSEGGLNVNAIRAGRAISLKFPQVSTIGGYRPSDPFPDHPSGNALDIMVGNLALGDAIHSWLWANNSKLFMASDIWKQTYWTSPTNGSLMEDRGSITENHFDHVHALFTPSPKGGPGMKYGGIPIGVPAVFEGGGGMTVDWGQVIGMTFDQELGAIRDRMPQFAGGIGQWAPKSIDKAMTAKDFMAKKAAEMTSYMGEIDDASGMVERWRPMMKAALIKQGLGHWANDPAILNRFMAQIDHESSGRPGITQQIVDINTGGNEAAGLGQIAKGTFASYRDPTLPNDPFDPWANLNAMARYVRGKYGEKGYLSIGNGIGYDAGGILPPTPGGFSTFYNHTGKPEVVLTSEQWNAIYRSASAAPTDYVASNIDLAARVNEQISGTFTPAVINILGAARAAAATEAEAKVETQDLLTSITTGLESVKTFLGEAKTIHEAVRTAVDETNKILEEDEKLAEVGRLVTEAMNHAVATGGQIAQAQVDALYNIARDYFAPLTDLVNETITAQQTGKPIDGKRLTELTEGTQAAFAGLSKVMGAWQPVVTSLTTMASNIADLKRIELGAWAYYGSPAGFGQAVERGLTHLGNIGVSTFNLAKNVLPGLVGGAFDISKSVVDFAAENGSAVAALVGAVVTGNPLAALPALPQLLSLAFDLLPKIISVIQNVVPALIKGITDLVESIFFGSSSLYAYETREAAEKAVANNLDAIRKGTFRPGQDVESGTLTPAGSTTNVTVNGNIVLPNVKGSDGAKKFVTSLENMK